MTTQATTLSETPTITRLDIAALASCDDLVYRYDRAKGASQLEAIKESSDTTPWEQRYVIPVTTHTTVHEDDYQVARAFYMWHDGRFNKKISTIVHLLRVGDTLAITLVANNNSGYLDEAGLHADEVHVTIRRSNGKHLALLAAYQVSPSNLARLCQMEPRRTSTQE